MGSGKTSIGKRVAARLGLEFHDCDHALEERTGASVSLIFDVEGEEGFRKRESIMLEELTAKKNVLVATGGGAVLSERNRRILNRSGVIVYLKTSVGRQLQRLERDRSRPLLQKGDKERKLRDLAASRNPVYQELADIVFPASNRSLASAADQLAQVIGDFLESSTASSPGRSPEAANHVN
jgi:shikimate kinase